MKTFAVFAAVLLLAGGAAASALPECRYEVSVTVAVVVEAAQSGGTRRTGTFAPSRRAVRWRHPRDCVHTRLGLRCGGVLGSVACECGGDVESAHKLCCSPSLRSGAPLPVWSPTLKSL